jgi:hypothetical protein
MRQPGATGGCAVTCAVMDVSTATTVDRSGRMRVSNPFDSTPGLVRRAVSAGHDPQVVARGGLSVADESRTELVRRLLASSGLLGPDFPDPAAVPGDQPFVALQDLIRAMPYGQLSIAVRGWGAALAALHRWPTRFGSPPSAVRPWMLETAGGAAGRAAGREESAAQRTENCRIRAAVAEVCADRSIRAALAEAGESWAPTHWTHGDMTTANVVTRRTGHHRWSVALIGLQAAGVGDPNWDLATAYDSLVLHRAHLGPRLRPLLRALLDGYRTAAGPARLTRANVIARAALSRVQLLASTDSPEHDPSLRSARWPVGLVERTRSALRQPA